MSDVEFIKSKLGVYPGFPKEVSSGERVDEMMSVVRF